MTEKVKFGDVVLLKFPFSDGKNYKKRPALVISDFSDGDVLVCKITSQLYNTKWDILVNDWEKSGLKLPSVIRVHKLATLEKELIEFVMGSVDISTKNEVKTILERTFCN